MDKAKAAAEVKRLRAQAKNEKIPQEARNEMLDKANEIEYMFYEQSKGEGMAKGGAVKKKPAAKKTVKEYGGKEKYASKAAMMKHEKAESPAKEKKEKAMERRSPVLAVMIGMTDKKKMAKGGYANCGASVKATGGKK
jgi:hypothetical protein